MISVTLSRPWLIARLPGKMRCLSWAPHRPGFAMADTILWREVRNADLGPRFDPIPWLAAETAALDERGAVALLTSRDIGTYHLTDARCGGVAATCLATVGLSNAERVGTRGSAAPAAAGTINIAVMTDAALNDTAMIEAVSIATQARTAAVMEAALDLPTGRATGTGTDCIVLACPPGDLPYAGLHTDVGVAIGAAVYRAVRDGADDWLTSGGGT